MTDEQPTLPGMPETPRWTDLPPEVRVHRWAGNTRLCRFCFDENDHPLPVAWVIEIGRSRTVVCTPHADKILGDRP